MARKTMLLIGQSGLIAFSIVSFLFSCSLVSHSFFFLSFVVAFLELGRAFICKCSEKDAVYRLINQV
jgi:hypothetical protein